jgi:hypothetical protein
VLRGFDRECRPLCGCARGSWFDRDVKSTAWSLRGTEAEAFEYNLVDQLITYVLGNTDPRKLLMCEFSGLG